jgi:hypothetical protein
MLLKVQPIYVPIYQRQNFPLKIVKATGMLKITICRKDEIMHSESKMISFCNQVKIMVVIKGFTGISK